MATEVSAKWVPKKCSTCVDNCASKTSVSSNLNDRLQYAVCLHLVIGATSGFVERAPLWQKASYDIASLRMLSGDLVEL